MIKRLEIWSNLHVFKKRNLLWSQNTNILSLFNSQTFRYKCIYPPWGRIILNWCSTLTFGNERACAAQGWVFARGGVTAQQWLRFIREEAFGAVEWRVLHCQSQCIQRFMAGTDGLAYIHRHHQLVQIKLQWHKDLIWIRCINWGELTMHLFLMDNLSFIFPYTYTPG